MTTSIKVFGMMTLTTLFMFFACVAGTLFGALAGLVVGLFFPETMHLLSQSLGIEASPYQLGAMFGFIGGFFRSIHKSQS